MTIVHATRLGFTPAALMKSMTLALRTSGHSDAAESFSLFVNSPPCFAGGLYA